MARGWLSTYLRLVEGEPAIRWQLSRDAGEPYWFSRTSARQLFGVWLHPGETYRCVLTTAMADASQTIYAVKVGTQTQPRIALCGAVAVPVMALPVVDEAGQPQTEYLLEYPASATTCVAGFERLIGAAFGVTVGFGDILPIGVELRCL